MTGNVRPFRTSIFLWHQSRGHQSLQYERSKPPGISVPSDVVISFRWKCGRSCPMLFRRRNPSTRYGPGMGPGRYGPRYGQRQKEMRTWSWLWRNWCRPVVFWPGFPRCLEGPQMSRTFKMSIYCRQSVRKRPCKKRPGPNNASACQDPPNA